MEQAEQGRRVQEALARLSPEHQAVLVMKDMEGQKYEIMAEVLKVPIGTIRSRLDSLVWNSANRWRKTSAEARIGERDTR